MTRGGGAWRRKLQQTRNLRKEKVASQVSKVRLRAYIGCNASVVALETVLLIIG